MSNKPHFILDPKDPNSADFRQDCMAWHMYTTMPLQERNELIAKNSKIRNDKDFKNRLRRCEAWWWLTYLNRLQIEENLHLLSTQEESIMRDHLNLMRAEIKKNLQIKHKTFMPDPRGKSHA